MKSRNKMLIVDGYNVLRSGRRYVHMNRHEDWTYEKFNKVREALISDVASFAGTEYRATIVFDAKDNAESAGKEETIGGVRIMFSSFGVTADEVIEKLAHQARGRNVEVLVVTSDAAIQDAVFGEGVDRMSADGFGLEMEDLEEDAAKEQRTVTKRRATVADRLDSDTLAKLKALRDGK